MKSQKGVTLISLTVYVIVMAIVVAMLAIITTFFYKNTKDLGDIESITEYTTFNSYFSDEVNHPNLKVIECKTENEENNVGLSYIVFSNGVQYTYVPENKGIYRNKVKIVKNIGKCIFKEEIKNGKSVITVQLKVGDQERETTYTLKD